MTLTLTPVATPRRGPGQRSASALKMPSRPCDRALGCGSRAWGRCSSCSRPGCMAGAHVPSAYRFLEWPRTLGTPNQDPPWDQLAAASVMAVVWVLWLMSLV